jgi:hypothetical protein
MRERRCEVEEELEEVVRDEVEDTIVLMSSKIRS